MEESSRESPLIPHHHVVRGKVIEEMQTDSQLLLSPVSVETHLRSQFEAFLYSSPTSLVSVMCVHIPSCPRFHFSNSLVFPESGPPAEAPGGRYVTKSKRKPQKMTPTPRRGANESRLMSGLTPRPDLLFVCVFPLSSLHILLNLNLN